MVNRNWVLSTVGAAAVLFAVCTRVDAAPLVVFNFNDFNATADVLAANLTSTTFANAGGLTSTSFASGAAAARDFDTGNAADAVTALDYWTFTLTADAGYQFDVASLALDEWRDSHGPIELQFWANGAFIGSEISTSLVSTNHLIVAPMLGLTSLAVRIVAWDDSSNGSNSDLFVDNVTIDGTVRPKSSTVPVPEPASLMLFGMGLTLAARRLRARA